MTHTECKDCELSNCDCGHHFKMDGTTNYDIASLSACDQYGNCMFFKSKAKPDTLISRESLKEKLQGRFDNGDEDFDKGYNIGIEAAIDLIDNAPIVNTYTEEQVQEIREDVVRQFIDTSICERRKKMDKDNGKMFVNDLGIYQRIYVEDNIFTGKLVITKEAFIEAYNRYIKEAENE